MSKYSKFLLFPLLLLLTACETRRTVEGRVGYVTCIGVDDEKDPTLKYEVSTLNVILGIVFIETIIVPVIVIFDQTYCPVGNA